MQTPLPPFKKGALREVASFTKWALVGFAPFTKGGGHRPGVCSPAFFEQTKHPSFPAPVVPFGAVAAAAREASVLFATWITIWPRCMVSITLCKYLFLYITPAIGGSIEV